MAATASEYLMYGLMFVLPLVGWGMLSAARYPVVLFGFVHLPFLLPHDAMLYAVLRTAHTHGRADLIVEPVRAACQAAGDRARAIQH
jgi:cytochrome b561